MKKSVPNPSYEAPYNLEHQKDFLCRAKVYYSSHGGSLYSGFYYRLALDEYYRKVRRSPSLRFLMDKPRKPQSRMDLINYLYKIGRDYMVLNCSFQQFHHFLVFDTPIIKEEPRTWYYSRGKRRPYPYRRPQTTWRRPIKYRRKPWHEKKEANPKQAWREHKGFERDYRRSRRHRDVHPYVKRHSWNKHRSAEQRYLARGDWEDNFVLGVKYHIDPWMWD